MIKKDFNSNLNYILNNLERNIIEAKSLEDKVYLELSKEEIIDYLTNAYNIIKSWEECNYDFIKDSYKEVESIISELELCLADYKDKFNMDGISYAIYEIGEYLTNG